MKKKSDALFNAFVGETVDILMKSTVDRIEQSEEGVSQQSSPMGMTGVFIDKDDNWVFIGEEDGTIKHAVNMDNISAISVHEEDVDFTPDFKLDNKEMN